MLKELNDSSKEALCEWLVFMLERVGHNNLPQLLDYYISIGWISEDVANRLLELADREKRYKGTSWTLSAEEHRMSLLFIEKIMGREIDNSLLNFPRPGRASLEAVKNTRPREGYLEAHRNEKENLEFIIHRNMVTIKNLEQELEDRDARIDELRKSVCELEEQLDGCRKELKKNNIYRKIFEENIRLKKGQSPLTGKMSIEKNVTL